VAPARSGEPAPVSRAPVRPHRRLRRRRLIQLAFVAPVVVYVVVMFAYPLVFGVSMSLEDFTFASLATGFAKFAGLSNYRQVFDNPVTWTAIVNTVIYTVITLFFQFGLGLAIASFFNRRFPLSRTLRTLILIPWLLPLIATGTIFRLLFAGSGGLVNRILADLHIIHSPIFWLDSRVSGMAAIIIVSIWAGLPFNTILLYAGLQDVPREIQEAAMVDGANAWQRFRKVTLPLIRPVAAIVLMLGLIYTVKTFDIVILLTNGGPGNATQLLATDAYTQVFSNLQFANGAAIGNILLLFCAIISVIYIWSIRRSERQA